MTICKMSLLVCFFCALCAVMVDANVTSFTHHLVLYECYANNTIYRFQYGSKDGEPTLVEPISPQKAFKLIQVGAKHEVVATDKRNLASQNNGKFEFRVKTPELIVEVVGEVRQCEQSSSTKCTILISVLASVSLLLFAALALSLIVLKEKQVPCLHKLSIWLRSRSNNNSDPPANNNGLTAPEGIDLEHLKRIYENGIKAEPVIDDSPPTAPANLPRKSSLKPPRTEAFLEPVAANSDISINPSTVRRKSMVTFNERTEIRT